MEEHRNFDDDAATMPLGRERTETHYRAQPNQRYQGGTPGYGPWGAVGDYFGRMRVHRAGETSPFFSTSEFAGTTLAIIALAITAAVMPNVNARLAWILIAAMVFTYAVSRGLAKAGTQSHSFDPRERLLGGAHHGDGAAGGGAAGGGTETRPFLVTSEFVGPLLAIIAVAISAATLRNLGAPLAWILITGITCGYVLSRGIAKIGNASRVDDPRERLLERTAGEQREPAAH